jgi:hypothetical protein
LSPNKQTWFAVFSTASRFHHATRIDSSEAAVYFDDDLKTSELSSLDDYHSDIRL